MTEIDVWRMVWSGTGGNDEVLCLSLGERTTGELDPQCMMILKTGFTFDDLDLVGGGVG